MFAGMGGNGVKFLSPCRTLDWTSCACLVVRRRMMEAPPPPPGVSAAAVVSPPDADNSAVLTCPRLSSGTLEVTGVQHRVNIIRHVSVPCDGSKSSTVEVPLSHSLPRPAPKTAQLSDKKVIILISSVQSVRSMYAAYRLKVAMLCVFSKH